MNTTLITGNTYAVKEELKALGGRWNSAAKGWDVPADKAAEAQALVDKAPVSERRGTGSARRISVTRFAGGAQSYRNSRGRCEDAPCCGCCS